VISVLAILVPIAALILLVFSGAFLIWSYRSVQRLSFGRTRTTPQP
jgi:hypothetical protein